MVARTKQGKIKKGHLPLALRQFNAAKKVAHQRLGPTTQARLIAYTKAIIRNHK